MKNIDIIQLEKERLEWSLKTFPEATAFSSLEKLLEEVKEVKEDLKQEILPNKIVEEYADCLMCLFDSAGRLGIKPELIFEAFTIKLEKNKKRQWVKNSNNTYSHVKNK